MKCIGCEVKLTSNNRYKATDRCRACTRSFRSMKATIPSKANKQERHRWEDEDRQSYLNTKPRN